MLRKLTKEFWGMLETEREILRVKVKKARIKREREIKLDNVYEHGYWVGKQDFLEYIMVIFGSLNMKEQKKKEE